jgi:hypothetical protein
MRSATSGLANGGGAPQVQVSWLNAVSAPAGAANPTVAPSTTAAPIITFVIILKPPFVYLALNITLRRRLKVDGSPVGRQDGGGGGAGCAGGGAGCAGGRYFGQ